jgi:hypothetical protein
MSLEIKWSIVNTERYTNDGLIYNIHWTASATEASNDPEKPYNAGVYNTQALERGDSFVNYDTLTEETVLGWLWGKIDKEAVEAALEAQIEAQKAPVISNGLPWSEA